MIPTGDAMAIESMLDVFNSKMDRFNKAVNERDIQLAFEIGSELIHVGLMECSKLTGLDQIKNTYRQYCEDVMKSLSILCKNPPLPIQNNGGSGDSDGSDPYYTEKQWFSKEAPKLNFTNIIGVQDVKDAFMVDVVAPLRPELKGIYKKFRGEQIGSQILLYGPPGTGKTHIVKCLAGSLNCNIAVVQTSEVLASVVGVAEKNIRDIFAQASNLDRCVIFFDEIDSICSDRDSDDSRNTKSILTTLLTCMDGFMKTKKEGQMRIIIAATNLPWKLDSALKRGGRFETQIYVPLPDKSAVEMFVRQGIEKVPHSADVTVEYLTNKLMGYSGADIQAVIRQIVNRPLRREVLNFLNDHIRRDEYVTRRDCEVVIGRYINSVTPEMLGRFEAYSRGISYEELIRLARKNS